MAEVIGVCAVVPIVAGPVASQRIGGGRVWYRDRSLEVWVARSGSILRCGDDQELPSADVRAVLGGDVVVELNEQVNAERAGQC